MTTSMKTPESQVPLAPVVNLSDQRAIRAAERKMGRKITPDNWMGTVKVAQYDMLESLNYTKRTMTKPQKWMAGLLMAGILAYGPVKDTVGPKIADHLRSVNEPALTSAEISAIPDEYHKQVDGHYAIGVDAVMAKADLDIEDPKIREAVENHIEGQISHNNPHFIDTVDAETYLEEQGKHKG